MRHASTPPSFWAYGLLLLFLMQAAGGARVWAAEPPQLPPGVQLERLAAPDTLKAAYRAEKLVVDWTHPLLRARLLNGLPAGEEIPTPWSRWSGADAVGRPPLLLQLSEPREASGRWSLALPLDEAAPGEVALAQSAPVSPVRQGTHVAVGGICPWLPGGPPLASEEPEQASPLAPSGAAVALRWLGRVEDLDQLTSVTLRGRCLLSWTSPAAGQTRFALVVRQQGGEGQLGDLAPWLRSEVKPGDWLALHAMGDYTVAGAGAWRLTQPGDSRRAERLGGALALSALASGEPVDWARLPGCTLRASSFEQDYPPANLVSGLLWPNPLAPAVWLSRLGAHADEPAWVELDLGRVRPLDHVVLLWPEAAGWSGQFNPRRVTLQAAGQAGTSWTTLAELDVPPGPGMVWPARQTLSFRRLRLTFTEPSSMPYDRRARLAALQVWGPWDGVWDGVWSSGRR